MQFQPHTAVAQTLTDLDIGETEGDPVAPNHNLFQHTGQFQPTEIGCIAPNRHTVSGAQFQKVLHLQILCPGSCHLQIQALFLPFLLIFQHQPAKSPDTAFPLFRRRMIAVSGEKGTVHIEMILQRQLREHKLPRQFLAAVDVDQAAAFHVDVQHGRIMAERKGISAQQHGFGAAGKVKHAVGMIPPQFLQCLSDAVHLPIGSLIKTDLGFGQPALHRLQCGFHFRFMRPGINQKDQGQRPERKCAQHIVNGIIREKLYQCGDLFHISASFTAQ